MARAAARRADAEPDTFDVPDPAAPQIRAEPAAELAGEPRATYSVSSWAGIDNYECTECPYATLDRALIERHLASHR